MKEIASNCHNASPGSINPWTVQLGWKWYHNSRLSLYIWEVLVSIDKPGLASLSQFLCRNYFYKHGYMSLGDISNDFILSFSKCLHIQPLLYQSIGLRNQCTSAEASKDEKAKEEEEEEAPVVKLPFFWLGSSDGSIWCVYTHIYLYIHIYIYTYMPTMYVYIYMLCYICYLYICYIYIYAIYIYAIYICYIYICLWSLYSLLMVWYAIIYIYISQRDHNGIIKGY